MATCQDALVSAGRWGHVTKPDLQMLSQLMIRATAEVLFKDVPGSWAPSLDSRLGDQKCPLSLKGHGFQEGKRGFKCVVKINRFSNGSQLFKSEIHFLLYVKESVTFNTTYE